VIRTGARSRFVQICSIVPLRILLCTLLCPLFCTFFDYSQAQAATKEKRNVAMILFRGETPSEQGFRETLAAAAEYDVQFTTFDAAQSKERLQEIIAGLDTLQYDMIYAFGTMAAQVALAKIKDTPIIFNVVQRPIEANVAATWEHSGNNATGASNMVSMESAFKTLALVLNIRKLAFVYNENDPAPRYQRADVEKIRKKFGFKVIDVTVQNTADIPEALKLIVNSKVDAVMFPSDSFIKANANDIMETLNKHRIPTIAIIPEMVRENEALMSLGPDYYELGQLAAFNALQVFGGKHPSDVPIQTVPSLKISINLKTADMLGVNVPLQLLSLSTIIR